MSKLGSWKFIVVLLSLVLLFSGCGGGGGGGNSTSNNLLPTPNADIDADIGSYTDTYDIASIMDGTWTGVSGSGTAIGSGGRFSILMSSITMNIFSTNVTGDTGTTYVTSRAYWDTEDEYYEYRALLFGDNEKANMEHIGSNKWRLKFSSGNGDMAETTVIITFTSEATATVTQEGRTYMNGGYVYDYSVNYTIKKTSGGDTNNNNKDTDIDKDTNTGTDVGTYTDTYDIASVLNGSWTGISGSGTATNENGEYPLLMSTMTINIWSTQISGNTGSIYMNYRQYWEYHDTDGSYLGRALRPADNVHVQIVHVGSNVWRIEGEDGQFCTITIVSETTAMIEEEGILTLALNNADYRCSLSYMIRKSSAYWY